MTFRLKDKNLQVQLDALSDGDFSKRLQHANHDDGMIFVEFGEKLESPGFDLHRFNLAFFDDVESTSQRMIASQRIRKFGRASSLTALALLFSKK